MKEKIAIIRLRGEKGLSRKVIDTLKMLRLYKKNTCVVIANNETNIGMLKVVKDYVTWGEITKDIFKLLLEKRGRLPGNVLLTEQYLKEKTKLNFEQFSEEFFLGKKGFKDVPGLKPFFRLNPPISGFERKGIKKAFALGGALGYRKEKINDLIKRMI